MKKILFALLIFAFVGCESGIATGELYLCKTGNDKILYEIYNEGGDTIMDGWTFSSMYISLPVGIYEVSAFGNNIWEGERFYMNHNKVTIHKDEVTTLHIAF